MIPVKQTKLHNPPEQNGNCFAAVIASILHLPIEEVISVEDLPDETWYVQLRVWLLKHDYQIVYAPEFGHAFHAKDYYIPEDIVKDKFYLASGKTSRFGGTVNHICIYKNGELIHDPHPDNTGLITFEYFQIIEKTN